MPRLITLAVAAYWATFFAVLALAVVSDPNGEAHPIGLLSLSGAVSQFGAPGGMTISSILAIGHLVVAILFIWTFATTLFEGEARRGDGDEVARVALGAAAVMMAVLLAVGFGLGTGDMFAVTSIQLVALLVSHVAVLLEAARVAERQCRTSSREDRTARVMALGAAQDSTLARLSRRGPSPERSL